MSTGKTCLVERPLPPTSTLNLVYLDAEAFLVRRAEFSVSLVAV